MIWEEKRKDVILECIILNPQGWKEGRGGWTTVRPGEGGKSERGGEGIARKKASWLIMTRRGCLHSDCCTLSIFL